MIDYTTVVGVDAKHLDQLRMTWPTWVKHKPSILEHPMVVFYDMDSVIPGDVYSLVDHPKLLVIAWPGPLESDEVLREKKDWWVHVNYGDGKRGKWENPQRYKMLSGFVHVPASVVKTKYWLKIDTDVVAVGQDNWIEKKWFEHSPAIVSHRWGFTKPPDQILKLDEWVRKDVRLSEPLAKNPPLELTPIPGRSKLDHKRIISFCAFFEIEFTKSMSQLAQSVCGMGKLPVPSQDGYLWYCAKRLDRGIIRVNVKDRGWQHWSTMGNVRKFSKEAMGVK